MDASPESEFRKPLREEPDLPRLEPAVPEFDLRSLLAMLARQWKTIAITMLIVLLAALALILRYNEKYAAVSLLEVDDQNERLIRIDGQVFEGGSFNARVDTEAQIIASSGVALKAIEGLKLWQTDEFGLRLPLIDRLAAWAGLEPAASLKAAPADFGSVPEAPGPSL